MLMGDRGLGDPGVGAVSSTATLRVTRQFKGRVFAHRRAAEVSSAALFRGSFDAGVAR